MCQKQTMWSHAPVKAGATAFRCLKWLGSKSYASGRSGSQRSSVAARQLCEWPFGWVANRKALPHYPVLGLGQDTVTTEANTWDVITQEAIVYSSNLSEISFLLSNKFAWFTWSVEFSYLMHGSLHLTRPIRSIIFREHLLVYTSEVSVFPALCPNF